MCELLETNQSATSDPFNREIMISYANQRWVVCFMGLEVDKSKVWSFDNFFEYLTLENLEIDKLETGKNGTI